MANTLLATLTAVFLVTLTQPKFAYADAASDAAACDALAASPKDIQRPSTVPGVPFADVKAEPAIAACEVALKSNPENARIQFEMGRALDVGGKEPERRNQLYKAAADKGHFGAMNNYGVSVYDANGDSPSLKTAAPFFCSAAAGGLVNAYVNCGYAHEHGAGVSKDLVLANDFYKRAAEAGDLVGMNNLGEDLIKGYGIKQDVVAGQAWLHKSIDGGDQTAPTTLAEAYDRGTEIPYDATKAAEYYLMGMKRDDSQAKTSLIEKSGTGVKPATLDAIQAQLKSEGKTFEASAGKLSPAVIAILKDYPKK